MIDLWTVSRTDGAMRPLPLFTVTVNGHTVTTDAEGYGRIPVASNE